MRKEKRQVYQQSKEINSHRPLIKKEMVLWVDNRFVSRIWPCFSWHNLFVYEIKDTIVQAFQQVFQKLQERMRKFVSKGLNVESAHLYGQEAPAFSQFWKKWRSL